MIQRTLRWRGFRLTVEVPNRVVDTLRGKPAPEGHTLRVLPSPPELDVDRHDADVQRVLDDAKAGREALGRLRTTPTDLDDPDALREAVDAATWYHTIDLPGGIVTPGNYDHRPLVPHYGFPEDLSGKRAMDVGTWDGFWAFELERRGADEVVAVDLERISQVDLPTRVREALEETDLDLPVGVGFEIASRALGSKVRRVRSSVYDLDPAEQGTFDLVHVGDVLLHLENPIEALRRIRSMTSGEAIIVDCYDPSLSSRRKLTEYQGGWYNAHWWRPSLDTLGQMVLDAGFSDVRVHTAYWLSYRNSHDGLWHAVLVARP